MKGIESLHFSSWKQTSGVWLAFQTSNCLKLLLVSLWSSSASFDYTEDKKKKWLWQWSDPYFCLAFQSRAIWSGDGYWPSLTFPFPLRKWVQLTYAARSNASEPMRRWKQSPEQKLPQSKHSINVGWRKSSFLYVIWKWLHKLVSFIIQLLDPASRWAHWQCLGILSVDEDTWWVFSWHVQINKNSFVVSAISNTV